MSGHYRLQISNKKLTKYEIRSSYCLRQFGFIYPYLTPIYHFRLCLELLICIYHYSPIFRLIYFIIPTLVIFALNCPDFTICAMFTKHTVVCILLLRKLFMEILHFKEFGMQKVLTRMQFVCLFSHWQLLGYTECRLAANTVVLECSKYHISIATNIRV